MKIERGEVSIVAIQFVALIGVVLLLSDFSPGQSAQSTPLVTAVYWGTPSQGVALKMTHVTSVTSNNSVITAFFSVAFSTKLANVAGSRICIAPGSAVGVSTTYTVIPFNFDGAKAVGNMSLSPTVQQVGWTCTYTIKITDDLSQTATWLGSVELTQ